MRKRKIKWVKVCYDNGYDDIDTFECDGTISISENARKANGFKNAEEWTEFHITWIEMHSPETGQQVLTPARPVEEVNLPVGLAAEDYINDPNFCGIQDNKVFFKKQQTQYDFDDFDFSDWIGGENGHH